MHTIDIIRWTPTSAITSTTTMMMIMMKISTHHDHRLWEERLSGSKRGDARQRYGRGDHSAACGPHIERWKLEHNLDCLFPN
jgi:hypothetical protein